MHDKNRHQPRLPAILDPVEPDADDLHVEPDAVEPDETQVPSHIPEDPERGRLVDPEDREPMKAARRGSWGYAAG